MPAPVPGEPPRRAKRWAARRTARRLPWLTPKLALHNLILLKGGLKGSEGRAATLAYAVTTLYIKLEPSHEHNWLRVVIGGDGQGSRLLSQVENEWR